jgi:hypothetical protein
MDYQAKGVKDMTTEEKFNEEFREEYKHNMLDYIIAIAATMQHFPGATIYADDSTKCIMVEIYAGVYVVSPYDEHYRVVAATKKEMGFQ